MKIRLRVAERLSVGLEIEVVDYDEEGVTLTANAVEVKLRYDDAETKSGSLIALGNRQYVFQGGSKSLEPLPELPVSPRPRSADNVQSRPRERPRSSPSSRAAEHTEVFFSFRFAEVEFNPVPVEIELDHNMESAYSQRLGFIFLESLESTILLQVTDPFAEMIMPLTVELGDDDVADGIVTIITHAFKQYALQGLGEDNGMFRFRVAEFYFPLEDQDTRCRRCE